MPQPKNTPATEAPQEEATPQAGEHNPAVNTLLVFAKTLATEKATLYERIEANRSTLRNYKTMGLLSEDQAKAIDAFYPKPKRGANAEAENGAAS